MNHLLTTTPIQITGISIHPAGALKHTLFFEFSVDDTHSGSVLWNKREGTVDKHSLSKPIDLRGGSALTIKVQEKHRFRRDQTFTLPPLTPEKILQGLKSGTPDKHRIPVEGIKKEIWLHFNELFSRTQSAPDDASPSLQILEDATDAQQQAEEPTKVMLIPFNQEKVGGEIRRSISKEGIDQGMELDATVKVHSRAHSQDLKDLARFLLRGSKTVDPRSIECLEGTRTSIIGDVMTLADDLDGPNVVWIRGAPGSGKSSLSLTITSLLRRHGRLVTYFRFDRSEASVTTSNALWSRVAYGLAEQNTSVLEHSISRLRRGDVNLMSTLELFTSFVEEPLSMAIATLDGPLVVVIDALDECGGFEGRSSPDRRTLLQTLRRWPKLPKHFKLLITSREEDDLGRVLPYISAAIDIPSGYFLIENSGAPACVEASNDIQMFLEKRFWDIRKRFPSLSQDWPGRGTIVEMVQRAAGNFMWATAAANFIDSEDPEEQLKSIMGQTTESVKPLYSLYSIILDASFGNLTRNSSGAETLRAVLGTTIFAQRPLSDDEYTKLPTTKPVEKARIEYIRGRLRSVLDQGPTVRFVHKTFDEFLLSEDCPPKYAINRDESQYLLIKLCFATIKTELRFNVCSLQTSCLKNENIPHIETKVKDSISGLLSYSCCFWAEHLSRTQSNNELVQGVREMIYDKLLYWFEAMSLLKETNRVPHALLLVRDWLKDKEIEDFVRDAHQFISTFMRPISQSAPHTYISALPFAPEHSLVTKHFRRRFPQTITLSAGKQTNWSPCTITSEHHKDPVTSVSFSPDENYFVSGCRKNTVCVCDSETGNLISGPFKGPGTLGVARTFFGFDGRHIWAHFEPNVVICWDIETGLEHQKIEVPESLLGGCCCSGGRNIIIVSAADSVITVRLWDVETGESLQKLLEIPEAGSWRSKISFSPDGAYMALAQGKDTAVRIWKLIDGSEIKGRLGSQGHTKSISVLSFAIDEAYVASGSEDGTILLWDAETGNITSGPVAAGKGEITAVAHSHENDIIVSSSGDPGMVMVWNATTHEAIIGPLRAHTHVICAIVLSRDGRRALSSSRDKTVKIWDLDRKELTHAAEATDGHSERVTDVAFTPCGRKLASVALDDTIRVWDVTTGKQLLSIPSHNLPLSGVIFSPDSSQIIAFSAYFGTIYVLNATTGVASTYQHTRIKQMVLRSTDHRLLVLSGTEMQVLCLEEGGIGQELSIQKDVCLPDDIISVTPDGSTAFVGYTNRNPRYYMWSTTTYQIHHPFPLTLADDEHLDSATFSPSGESLLVGTYRGSRARMDRIGIFRLWKIQTGEIALCPFMSYAVSGTVAISPDECNVAFAVWNDDSSIWIWNTRTDHLATKSWNGHLTAVSTLAYSPDGKKLVSGGSDGQIRVWDTADLIEGSLSSSGPFDDSARMRDGWVTNENEELLFWVPSEHRTRLCWPRTIGIIDGGGTPTRLDMTKFTYGEKWTESNQEAENTE